MKNEYPAEPDREQRVYELPEVPTLDSIRAAWLKMEQEIRPHDGKIAEELEDYLRCALFRISGFAYLIEQRIARPESIAMKPADLRAALAVCEQVSLYLLTSFCAITD